MFGPRLTPTRLPFTRRLAMVGAEGHDKRTAITVSRYAHTPGPPRAEVESRDAMKTGKREQVRRYARARPLPPPRTPHTPLPLTARRSARMKKRDGSDLTQQVRCRLCAQRFGPSFAPLLLSQGVRYVVDTHSDETEEGNWDPNAAGNLSSRKTPFARPEQKLFLFLPGPPRNAECQRIFSPMQHRTKCF